MRCSWPSLPSLPSRAWVPVAQADPPPAHRRLLPPHALLALAACLLAALLLPALLLPPPPPPTSPTSAAADRRPHLLLLLADQARLSAHGLLTPHLDAIATHGARFARAYSSTPVCTPARAALLTGRSAWRHGLRVYAPHVAPPLASRAELAATLAAHGYHTALVGKSHFGVDPATGDFRAHGYAERHLHEGLLLCDERSAHFVRADEYAAFFARACAACDPLRTGRPALDAWRVSERNGSTVYNVWKGYEYPYDEALHPTRWTADTAIKLYEAWLRRRHAGVSSQPLFLTVSFHRPHAPYDPPARWVARLRSHRIPPPAGDGNWAHKWAGRRGAAPPPPPPPHPAASPPGSSHPSPPLASPPLPSAPRATHPAHPRCSAARAEFCGGNCGYQSFCGSLPPADASHTRLMYYASLAFVDEQAGAILARVRASAEEYARMLVLYTSDHGDALGDHHLWRKGYPYEDVASIPFYLRWPEAMDAELSVGRGVVLQHLVELRDVFPTLAAAAGIALPSDDSGPDGKSLWPLLSSGGGPWRQQLLLELAECSFDGQAGGISWVSVTDGRGKYVWFMLSGEEQLFNLTADPSELVDLAREPGAETRLRAWRSRLAHEFEREGRGSEWTAGGTIPPGAHRRRCGDFLFTPNYKGAAPAPPPPDREGSAASNPNGMEDTAASHSQGTEGTAASHIKGSDGALAFYPNGTEGAVASYPNGTEGALASYPNGTEGALASYPNGTEGALASYPNGTEGALASYPNGTEGALASYPNGTEGALASYPNGTEGALASYPNGTEGALASYPNGTEGALASYPNGTEGALASYPNGTEGALASYPNGTEGALASYPNGTEGALASYPNGTEGALASYPNGTEGALASYPNGTEGALASYPNLTEGALASYPNGTEGALASYPNLTEGALASYPNGTEGALASYPNLTEGALASYPNLTEGAVAFYPNGTEGAAASHPNGKEGMATSRPDRAEGTASHPSGTKDAAASHPNVVFVLTDDQDLMLGGGFPNDGATPMPHTQRLLADQGAVATNFFAHTSICCPSRAQLLTGRYFHNLKVDPKRLDASSPASTCMHVNTSGRVHAFTFAKHLKRAGYTVGVFGKWLNTVANWNSVPPGVDAWFVNGGGDYIAPKFHARHLAHLGVRDGTWVGGTHDYSTAVVGNLSLAWVELQARHTRPFFAYVAPKASHEPFTPAPWHAEHWEAAWPADAPRTPNWNCSFDARARHHGNIATSPMLTAAAAAVIRGAFRNRWRTLLSVDAVVAALVGACERGGVAERTYFAFTSDHGFQLGQLNLPLDKRHVYDWNTRVPLLLRGPGIAPRSVLRHAATLVDLAPTFLGMAGVARPDEMDGRSLLPLLVDASAPALPAAVRAHLEALGPAARYGAAWRDAVLLEHLFVDENTKCMANCTPCAECRTPSKDVNCATPRTESGCWSTREAKWKQLPTKCSSDCFPTENLQNNFVALRHVAGSPFGDSLYAEFQAGQQDVAAVDFSAPPIHIELFNITQDPWQMDNLHSPASAALEHELRAKLHSWLACQGAACP